METHPNSSDMEKRRHLMVSRIREHDFRITPQQLVVLKILTTRIDTVYKTVNL